MPETTLTAPESKTFPVYAAGAGQPDLALNRLREAAWTRYTDDLGNVTYISPDGAVRAEFGPETDRYARNPHSALWQVTYADPDPYATSRKSWTATYGDNTPAEAIAAFLITLIAPEGLDPER